MRLLTKIVCVVSMISCSLCTLAASYTPPICHPELIYAPCDTAKLSFGFEAFFVEAISSNTSFLSIENFSRHEDDAVSTLTEPLTILSIKPNEKFSWELEGSYALKQGNRIKLSWQHIDHRYRRDVALSGIDNIFVTTITDGDVVSDSTLVDVSVLPNNIRTNGNLFTAVHHIDFDAANIEWHQLFQLGEHVAVSLFTGAEYMQLDYTKRTEMGGSSSNVQTSIITVANVVTDHTRIVTNINEVGFADAHSKFEGLGPHVGADALADPHFYDLHLMLHASAELLIGNIDTHQLAHRVRNTDSTGFDILNNTVFFQSTSNSVLEQHHHFDKHTMVVPSGTIKLGVARRATITPCTVDIEGGWRWQGYYHVLRFQQSAKENFTQSGPYVKVRYVR